MKRVWISLVAAATGGLLAGVLLGFVETIILSIFSGWTGLSSLLWAVATYGFLGLLGGAALGFLVSLLFGRWLPRHPNWWMLMSGAVVFSGAGFIVIRFRLMRDLFQERATLLSTESLIMHGILVVVFGGIVLAAWFIGRRWAKPGSTTKTDSVSTDSPTSPASDSGTDLSRRKFLKASLATGLVVLPAAAVISRVGDRSASFAPVHLSDRMQTKLRDKPNIILIAADTLRADHMGSYGYAKAITPHLDDLAAQSTQFMNAFAQSAWTKPSMATLLTSLYPSTHATRYKTSALPSSIVTLPGILQSQGYVTGGFANNVNIAPIFNFQQGFTDYEFLAPDYLLGASEASSQFTAYQTARMLSERLMKSRKNVHNFYQPGEVVTERAIDWLEARQDDRFFLFLHYMDPHDPYFEHPFNNHGVARVSTPNPPPDMAPDMVKLYDQEITYMDQQLGELFGWLKQQGLYDNTMIVFTADHGEEFYEHGGWWHGLTLYDEQIHVPLLVKGADQTSNNIDADLARSLDIAPTIIRAAGFDVLGAMQGVDLFGELEERAKFVFSEEDHQGNVLQAGRNTTWKVMEANAGNPRGLPTDSLFHVAEDPGETQNLSETEPGKMAVASAHVADVSTWAKANAVAAAEVELDQATRNLGNKLGYGR